MLEKVTKVTEVRCSNCGEMHKVETGQAFPYIVCPAMTIGGIGFNTPQLCIYRVNVAIDIPAGYYKLNSDEVVLENDRVFHLPSGEFRELVAIIGTILFTDTLRPLTAAYFICVIRRINERDKAVKA